VILPTREALERRRKGYQRRGVVCALFFVLLAAASLAPHVGVRAAEGVAGRSLIPATRFFIKAEADAPGFAATNVTAVAAGLNITYFGFALQQVGSLIGLFVFFALAADGVGRWTRRGMLVSGALLTVSAPTVVLGYLLLQSGGVATDLGVAWFCALAAGLIMVLGGHEARKRLDSTWYWSRPELNG
jgi:hypothetical protein